MLEAALVAGFTSGGGCVEIAGVIPTPGLAALVVKRGADAGVVVSASHNPFADNGIKFFSHLGLKLSDDEEAKIEEHVTATTSARCAASRSAVPTTSKERSRVTSGMCQTIPLTFPVCASPSTAPTAPYRSGPAGPERVGATSCCLHRARRPEHQPRLRLHPPRAPAAGRAGRGFDLGFAFDGDGDRVLAVEPAAPWSTATSSSPSWRGI